jgi:hypothetical protein
MNPKIQNPKFMNVKKIKRTELPSNVAHIYTRPEQQIHNQHLPFGFKG